MNEEVDKTSKSLLIGIIAVIIVILIAIVVIVATTDDNNPIEEQTINETERNEQEEKEKQEKLKKLDTFLKVIEELKYIEAKDIYKYNVLLDEKTNGTDVYNVSTGDKITTFEDGYITWYGNFGILSSKDTEIIDNYGDTLFKTDESLTFYPNTKLWEYDGSIYDINGLVEKNATIIDEAGNYIVTEKNGELVLENNKLKTIYSSKLEKDDSVRGGELSTIYDEPYAFLTTDNYGFIVDTRNGKEVSKNKIKNIEYLKNNLFAIEGSTYFVKSDHLALKVEGTDYKTEASTRYVAIGNHVYDANNLNEVDTNTFIPDEKDIEVEKLTGLELTQCRTGYGLKYKGEQLLNCEYEVINYFNSDITTSLISSNKLLLIISKDGYGFELYDVYNKKVIMYNIDDYDYNSPFVTLYQDDNIYIYNIIDGSKTPNHNGDKVELYPNYYVLSSGGTLSYYNKDFKEILKQEKREY